MLGLLMLPIEWTIVVRPLNGRLLYGRLLTYGAEKRLIVGHRTVVFIAEIVRLPEVRENLRRLLLLLDRGHTIDSFLQFDECFRQTVRELDGKDGR